MRRRRPARFASSVISRAERLIPASLSDSSASRAAASASLADSSAAFSSRPASGDAARLAGRLCFRRGGPNIPANPKPAARSFLPRSESRKRASSTSPAENRAAAATSSPSPSSAASTASVGRAAKSTVWQREEIVSSSASGSELSRIRWAKPGGSSSVFSKAFWLSSRIASADSTTKTRSLALEGAVGGGADDALAHRLDQVLGAARREPDQVGMGRGVDQGAAAGVVGVGGAGGEDLGGEGAGRGALAGAARAAEEVGVGRPGVERRGERRLDAGLMRRPSSRRCGPLPCYGTVKVRSAHADRPLTTSITRSWTSSTLPVASMTTTRSEAMIAISS